MAINEEAERIAKEIEETYGTDVLLKVAYSALSKLLIDKGIINRHKLNEYFLTFAEDAKKEIG